MRGKELNVVGIASVFAAVLTLDYLKKGMQT